MSKTQKPTAREIWSNEALRLARTKSGFKIRIGEIERRLDHMRHLLAARDASIQEEACISETLFRPASLPSLGSIDDLGEGIRRSFQTNPALTPMCRRSILYTACTTLSSGCFRFVRSENRMVVLLFL